jgi:hypothetical protein
VLSAGFHATPFATLPASPNRWYHIELRNFDWSGRTFDYYVNDRPVRLAVPFAAEAGSGVQGIRLGHPPGAVGYWDELALE